MSVNTFDGPWISFLLCIVYVMQIIVFSVCSVLVAILMVRLFQFVCQARKTTTPVSWCSSETVVVNFADTTGTLYTTYCSIAIVGNSRSRMPVSVVDLLYASYNLPARITFIVKRNSSVFFAQIGIPGKDVVTCVFPSSPSARVHWMLSRARFI